MGYNNTDFVLKERNILGLFRLFPVYYGVTENYDSGK